MNSCAIQSPNPAEHARRTRMIARRLYAGVDTTRIFVKSSLVQHEILNIEIQREDNTAAVENSLGYHSRVFLAMNFIV